MEFIALTGFGRFPQMFVKAEDIQCLLREDDTTIVTLRGGDYQRVIETPEQIVSLIKEKEKANGKED